MLENQKIKCTIVYRDDVIVLVATGTDETETVIMNASDRLNTLFSWGWMDGKEIMIPLGATLSDLHQNENVAAILRWYGVKFQL